MKWALLITAVAIAALTYFYGLRVGYVTLVPTYMYNAQGVSTYTYQTYPDGTKLGVVGICDTRSGQATLRLYDPSGKFVSGQTCVKGRYGVSLGAREDAVGFYRLEIELDHYTGRLELDERR